MRGQVALRQEVSFLGIHPMGAATLHDETVEGADTMNWGRYVHISVKRSDLECCDARKALCRSDLKDRKQGS